MRRKALAALAACGIIAAGILGAVALWALLWLSYAAGLTM